jgi:hypothetical protein
LVGIIFGYGDLFGYGMMGIGVVFAVVDMVNNLKIVENVWFFTFLNYYNDLW